MAQIIAGGTKPDSGGNVEVITQTQTTTWTQLQGKPYIEVSSKGIVNGLSNIPNDGADFGPDTTLGATAPGQYGSPYTQTVGWQEALNYLVTKGGGKMSVMAGYYEMGENNVGISSGVSGSTLPAHQTPIEIEGEAAITNTLNGGPISDFSIAGVVIHSTNATGVNNTILNFSGDVAVRIKNIIVSQPQYTSGYGMKIAFVLNPVNGNSFIAKNCFAMVDGNPASAYAGGSNGIGISGFLNNTASYPAIFENCTAFGYPTGFSVSAHAILIGGGAVYCQYGLAPTGELDHPITLQNFDLESCEYYISTHVWGITTPVFIYGTLNIEWTTSASLYNIINFIDDPDNILAGEIELQGHITGSTGASLTPIPLSTLNNNGGLNLRIMQKPNNPAPTTPTVPASGTSQQNTNPYAIDAYVYGGAVTEIQITRNGTAYTVFSNSTGLALLGQAYKLNPGDSITVTYTTAPSWEWLSD